MIRAHELNDDGLIVNTVIVHTLDYLPNLIDASIGGGIGDSVIDGILVPAPKPEPEPEPIPEPEV